MAPSCSKAAAQFAKPTMKPMAASLQKQQNAAVAPAAEVTKNVNPVLTNIENKAPPSAPASSSSNSNTEKVKTGKSL